MNNYTSSTPELSAGDISSSIDILEKIVNVTNSSGSSIVKEVSFISMFVWFLFSHSIIVHWYGDAAITGEKLEILTYSRNL